MKFPAFLLILFSSIIFWGESKAQVAPVLTQPDRILQVPNHREINSFEALLAPFKGQVVLVDLWATWCGPCRTEFKRKQALTEFIKDKDIVLLYISVDRPSARSKWNKLIKDNHLIGYHILANRELMYDIREKFHRRVKKDGRKALLLPTYLVVDKKGKVVKKDAPRPSEGKALFRVLKRYL